MRVAAVRLALPTLAAALVLLATSAAVAAESASNGASGSPLVILVAVVMGFGALGGFVDGLTTDITYRVNFGSYSKDIGSLGDALAGATAAIAIFTVGNALFPQVELKSFGTDLDHSIRIVAVSVLSGYAGVRLLNPLTRKLVEQISTDKANEATRTLKGRDDELVISLKDGDRQVYRFDSEREKLIEQNKATALLDGARKSYEIAVQIEPNATEGFMGLAKVARRRAELNERKGMSGEADWNEALELLDRVTSRNPRAARAYYNKACYKQARRKASVPDAEALRDLRSAIELQSRFKHKALVESDFEAIRDSEAFKAAVQ
jgi:hypothetical protein